MNALPIISILTFLPIVGGILLLGLAPANPRAVRRWALLIAFAGLALVLVMAAHFDSGSGLSQFSETRDWVGSLGIQYKLGVDGLSLLMLLLTAIVVPMAILASREIQEQPSLYYSLILFLQAGLFGTFTALNFFHWFIFWELSLIPAFFLIKLWGGPARSAAATQFFVYTMAGSVAMLLAFLALFWTMGTFDFGKLSEMGRDGTLFNSALVAKLGWKSLPIYRMAQIIFAGVFLGFAVKVPLVPFHAWLPNTYAEAPTPVTMLLTGLMSKMGVYGFVRIVLPIFPTQMIWLATPLLWLAVITIVVSAAAAFAQRDLKRMLAYSSINHLGYCLLGIFAVVRAGANAPLIEKSAALNGVFLQMFNHGLTAATLFWFVGMLEERGGVRTIDAFGGLRKVAPVFCGLMGIALFSSLGLPGLNGFIGEFLIFKGAFPLATWASALAVLGLLITAVFILTMLQRVFNGPLNAKWAQFPDLTFKERALVAPALVLMLVLGIYPQVVLGLVNSTVGEMVRYLKF
jgi:NADH-quinone oxidoreductase subunit M